MKNRANYELLISSYIDGTCKADEKEFVEKELLTQPQWKEYYRDLMRIRSGLQSIRHPFPQKNLWPAIIQNLTDRETGNTERPEVIPRRLVPVATVLAMLVVGFGSFTAVRNWNSISEYFSEKRALVEDIYDQGIIEGALRPLFTGLTNDDMLQFALSGTLTIPEAGGHALHIDSDSPEQYDLEITDSIGTDRTPSFAEFTRDLDLSDLQKNKIDSVFAIFRDRIAQSAFIVEDREMMVSPDIVGLDKFILASVAHELKPAQRDKFNTILFSFNPELHIPSQEVPLPTIVISRQSRAGEAAGHTDVVAGHEHPAAKATARPPAPPRPFIVLKSDTVITGEFTIAAPQAPDVWVYTESSPGKSGHTAAFINEGIRNTKIRISPFTGEWSDSLSLQIYAQMENKSKHPGEYQQTIRIETKQYPQSDAEYFRQLRDISRELRKRSEMMRSYAYHYALVDSIQKSITSGGFEDSLIQYLGRIQDELGRFSYVQRGDFVFPESLFHDFHQQALRNDPELLRKLHHSLDSLIEQSPGRIAPESPQPPPPPRR